jgi:PAS domain S-box-containing protein
MKDVDGFAPPARPTADAGAQLREKVNRALRHRGRLEAVHGTGLLESAQPIPALDRITRLAGRALGAPTVVLSLLTDKLIHPVSVHLDREQNEHWDRPRKVGYSVAKYVVWSKGPLLVGDALRSDLLRHSHATRDYDTVAYLGVPIMARAATGTQQFVVGALSAIGQEPRSWSQVDVDTLTDLAAMASEEIELRRRTSSAALAAHEQTSRVIEGISVGVLGTDAHGVITYANPAAEAMLGYAAADLVGRDQHALIHHSRPHGVRYPESQCPYYIARREMREAHTRDDTYWRSDGTSIAIDATMTPIIERGELTGTVLTFVGVTARQEAELAERVRRDAAEAANRAKSALIASMTEELDAALAQLARERDALEVSIASSAGDATRIEMESLHQSERRLRALVDSMRHVSEL